MHDPVTNPVAAQSTRAPVDARSLRVPQPVALRLAAVGGRGLDRPLSTWDAPGRDCSGPRGSRSVTSAARGGLGGSLCGGLDRPVRGLLPARGLGGAFRWGGVWPLSALLGRSASRRAERALS